MVSKLRLFALIHVENDNLKSRHFIGIPPELTEGEDYRQPLPHPKVLIIEEEPEGTFLYRFAGDGSFGGDTWHSNVDDAKHQAQYEYADAVGEWKQIPPQVADAVKFALSYIE